MKGADRDHRGASDGVGGTAVVDQFGSARYSAMALLAEEARKTDAVALTHSYVDGARPRGDHNVTHATIPYICVACFSTWRRMSVGAGEIHRPCAQAQTAVTRTTTEINPR